MRRTESDRSAQGAPAFQWNVPSPDSLKLIDACSNAASKIADVSEEEEARDLLTLATDKYAASVNARIDFKRADERSGMASAALAIYEEQKDASFNDLYMKVPESAPSIPRAGAPVGHTGSAYGEGNALVTFEAFNVWGGQIHAINAFVRGLPLATARFSPSSDPLPK